MDQSISKMMMKTSALDIERLSSNKVVCDSKISTNESEIRDQVIQTKLLNRALGKGVSPEFIKDFNYIKKHNFDIKKMKKYDCMVNTYNELKNNPDEYSRFYCDAFEFLTSSNAQNLIKTSMADGLSKESFDELSLEGIFSFFKDITTIGNNIVFVGKVLSIISVVMIFLLIVCIIYITIVMFKISKTEKSLKENYSNKSSLIRDMFNENFKYMTNGLIKPCIGFLPFVKKLSVSPKSLFSKIKSDELKIQKQSNEFLFTASVVLIGIGLAIKFVRWAISFYFNLRICFTEELENVRDIIAYRIDEVEKEIDDPNTPKVKRDSLIKIKKNLERELEKIDKRLEAVDGRSKKAIVETTAEEQDDITVVEAEKEQDDDTNSNGPSPVFL